MKSTLGRRASICKELGWSLGFVEHGISYCKLQMIMMDMPRIIHTGGKKTEHFTITDDNAEEMFGMMMRSTTRQ